MAHNLMKRYIKRKIHNMLFSKEFTEKIEKNFEKLNETMNKKLEEISNWDFETYFPGNSKGISITRTKDSTVCHIEVPGFKKDQIDVRLYDTVIKVKAKNDSKELTKMFKVFNVPGEEHKITSVKLEDGILAITFNKKTDEDKGVKLDIE